MVMGLEPIGNSEVDIAVEGSHVTTEQITEDGEINISLDYDLSNVPLMSGNSSRGLDSPTGEEGTALLFDLPEAVPVEIEWSTMIREDYDRDVVGDEVIVRADGSEVHHNYGPSYEDGDELWMSGSTTVEASRAEVYYNTAYADWPNVNAGYYDVSWDASQAFSEDVGVNINSRDVNFSPK